MRTAGLAILFFIATLVGASPSTASECTSSGSTTGTAVLVGVQCTHGSKPDHGATAAHGSSKGPKLVGIVTQVKCTGPCVTSPPDQSCANGQRFTYVWAVYSDGSMVLISASCMSDEDQAPGEPPAAITPGLVLEALRRIDLPAATVHTNPEHKTLVNLETVFYTDPTSFTRTLPMLGHQVEVESTSTRYAWNFGDGTHAASTTPGRAYPHKDLTHRYLHSHITAEPSVDVTYAARYRVDGGPWTPIPGTVTVPGDTIDLQIAEAVPVLSGNR